MRYSEAIRLGSMLYPQCIFGLARTIGDGSIGVCANGAAAIALGISIETLLSLESGHLAPPVVVAMVDESDCFACPKCDHFSDAVTTCAHMNDEHGWTRERIADWLAASGHDFEIDLAKPECAPATVAAGVAE